VPNRIVREAILTSERVASLAWPEEVFYRRLMSIVDDYGRSEANPQLLRSKCYPLQTDTVRAADISRWMAACQKAGLILGYEVAGKQYLELQNFGQQQRSASKCPAPPADASKCNQPPADAHLDVSVSVSEDVGVSRASAAPAPRGKRTPKTGLPEDFGVSEAVKAWAAEKGYGQLQEHLEAFKRKATANGYAYANWDAAFMEAIREDWAKLRGKTVNGVAPAAEPRRHDSAEETRRMLAEKDKGTTTMPDEMRGVVAQLTGRKVA
jgi:hypothetical protein